MRKGFTLVELSIVLVIIGLLIGGILVAQSMIKTAQINGIIKQLSQYDVAIANFHTKFNQLPGDTNRFGTIGCGGNCNNNGAFDGSGYETNKAWEHLSLGVDLKNKFNQNFTSAANPFAATNENNCPSFNIDQDRNLHACVYIDYPSSLNGRGRYRYQETPIGLAATYAPLNPADAYALDIKLDDGLANAGDIVTMRWGAETTPLCNNLATYNIANKYGCTMQFPIGRFNGISR